MCACVCACVCMCVSVCLCVCVSLCVSVHVYVCTHTHVHLLSVPCMCGFSKLLLMVSSSFYSPQVAQSLGSSSHVNNDPYVFDVEGPAILSDLRNKCANSSRITSTGEICQEKVKDSVDFSIFAGLGKVGHKVVRTTH